MEEKPEDFVQLKMDQFNSAKNSGVLIAPPKEGDYIFGSTSQIEYKVVLADGNWDPYLPTPESQLGKYFDTMACVTVSCLNSAETQINYYLKNNLLHTAVVAELNQLGYIDENGNFNASDRFLAKMSGTTHQGNYLNVVAETLRTQGVCPEVDWAWDRNQIWNWEDYYSGITNDARAKALRFLDFFTIQYEWVPANQTDLIKHLKQAPIQVATAVCAGWNQGDVTPVPACSQVVQHATIIYYDDGQKKYDFDHYAPFKKYLAGNYPIPYMLKILVTPKEGDSSMIRLLMDKSGTGRLEFGQGASGFNLGIQSPKFFEMVKSAGIPVVPAEPTTKQTYTVSDEGFIINKN